MIVKTQYDNASQRINASAHIYNIGSKEAKRRALERLPEGWSSLHNEGYIHIHDLETYKYTYNCLQMDILKSFPYSRFKSYTNARKIMEIFGHFRNLIQQLGHEQSGGIGFPNFDDELSQLFNNMSIPGTEENLSLLRDSIESFVDWSNDSHVRNCQYSFYVTLNLGLSTTVVGRAVTRFILDYFRNTHLDVIKPNIIFKVKNGANYSESDPNRDLFVLAKKTTCYKMIPTFLLFDSASNSQYDPFKIAIMGCRTKVAADLFGESRSIGRGNIDYITINLPRLALEANRDYKGFSEEEKLAQFLNRWQQIACVVKDILVHRYSGLVKLAASEFPANTKYSLWLEEFKSCRSMEEVFKHGTLSIGFIGLSEAYEVLTERKFFASPEDSARALALVKHMRQVVDGFKDSLNLNFTLLASSGEFISGRFPDIDEKSFTHPLLKRKYYTNSFHVDVDSGIHPLRKIQIEGPFHIYANGGSISYVEFASAPLNNIEAISDIIEAGVNNGVNYLGINFPLDQCRQCGTMGTFDICPTCDGDDIYRVRRVSGYLENLEFFTLGKKAEVSHRSPNCKTT